MPASDREAIESEKVPTPRVSGESAKQEPSEAALAPHSALRVAHSPDSVPASSPEDTLLSAGKPADRLELMIEDRLAVTDLRIDELQARLEKLERRPAPAPEVAGRPWLWLVFLVALAAVFQLLRLLK